MVRHDDEGRLTLAPAFQECRRFVGSEQLRVYRNPTMP
jgi:hypothetical protein